jgi:transposase InsO family protein
VVDTSLTAPRIVRELDRIVETRGCPRMIVSDNGTEFTSNAILRSLPLKLSTKPFCIGLPGAM